MAKNAVRQLMELYPRIYFACHTRHVRDPRTRRLLSACRHSFTRIGLNRSATRSSQASKRPNQAAHRDGRGTAELTMGWMVAIMRIRC